MSDSTAAISVTLFGFRQLISVGEIWTFITTFTVLGCAVAYFVAGLVACRVVRQRRNAQYLWLPLVTSLAGGVIGFTNGCITAVLIAGLYVSIPYAISSDVAAALGLAQSALIIYFHLGRGESLSHTFRQS